MSHADVALNRRDRLRLARLIVEVGETSSAAAKMFMTSPVPARKWAQRYRFEGAAGMTKRSRRPHRSPTRTDPQTLRRIVRPRWR